MTSPFVALSSAFRLVAPCAGARLVSDNMPKFSVVVPTRERPDTLASCLRTCLDQAFDDYEVIVCDNASSPRTREIVESFDSPKLKYVRAPELLPMSLNWELAVSHAAGDYVMVLGDHDALLPHALKELNGLVERLQVKAIRWPAAMYMWPNVGLEAQRNYLRIPLGRGIWAVNGHQAIAHIASFRVPYNILPMFYNSIVHRDVVRAAREEGGRVFGNYAPDVYSGFAFAYLARSYVSVDVPMTIAGLSQYSTGLNTIYLGSRHAATSEFHRLNREAGLGPHRWMPELIVFPVVPVADSFLRAKEALFPGDDALCLDRRIFLTQCLRSLAVERAEDWPSACDLLRDSTADDAALTEWFDGTVAAWPPSTAVKHVLWTTRMGFLYGHLHLDASRFEMERIPASGAFGDGVDRRFITQVDRTGADSRASARFARSGTARPRTGRAASRSASSARRRPRSCPHRSRAPSSRPGLGGPGRDSRLARWRRGDGGETAPDICRSPDSL